MNQMCKKCGRWRVTLQHQRLCKRCWQNVPLRIRRALAEQQARINDALDAGDRDRLGGLVTGYKQIATEVKQ